MPAQSALITVMAKAAEKAARGLKRDFGEVEHLQVTRKGPGDFVSNADKNAEKMLREELTKARPAFAFLGEEGGASGVATEGRWIVDPLDGTNNFLHGIPHWCISIGCEVKGELHAGIVFDPIKDEMFWAEKGVGAYLNNRRIRVSARKNVAESVVCTGIMPSKKDLYSKALKQLEAAASTQAATRMMGSGALGLAYVATGRFESYWENMLHPWDVAAGVIIVREAGGQITRLDGSKYELGSHDILSSNSNVHTEMVALLK